jgi:acetylornithine deacetylase/succinyl-diaminopimelate desuccinylase-like protein
VFLRHADAMKCGPGTSARSHTPDECVEVAEVAEARAFYAALAAEVLA